MNNASGRNTHVNEYFAGFDVRDVAAQDDPPHRKSYFALGFMDQVLNTTTIDDLKVLGYEDEV